MPHINIAMPEFVDYNELFQILNKKYNATHDELRYWIKCDSIIGDISEHDSAALFPFMSDIPTAYDGLPLIHDELFNPIYYFFMIEDVHNYFPAPQTRFIYRMNLTSRECWSVDFLKSQRNMNILEKAQRAGLLRCYNKETDDFTLYKTFKAGDKESKRLWCNTDEGINILNDPESFFLLEDILRIERAFFNKPLESCLKELEINMPLPNLKVVSLQNIQKD